MAVELKKRKVCPLCASPSGEIRYDLAYNHTRLKHFLVDFYGQRADIEMLGSHHYQIKKCQQCNLLYQVAILNGEGQALLYEEWVDNDKSLLKKQQAKAKLFRQYAGQLNTISRLLPQPPHQSHILEFGMGWGYWSRIAIAHGYQVSGLELSPERAEHARSLGVSVIESLPEAGLHYDLVFASQVFEHLEKPLEVLIDLVARLKPGGIVYLRVPDGAGVEGTLRRSGWNESLDAIHPLEHINCFTRKTLILMAERAGLTQIQPPLRLEWSTLWGGVKREVNDRFLTTHVYFKKQ